MNKEWTQLQGSHFRERSNPARCLLSQAQSAWNGKHISHVGLRGHTGLEQPFSEMRILMSQQRESVPAKGQEIKDRKMMTTSGPWNLSAAQALGWQCRHARLPGRHLPTAWETLIPAVFFACQKMAFYNHMRLDSQVSCQGASEGNGSLSSASSNAGELWKIVILSFSQSQAHHRQRLE